MHFLEWKWIAIKISLKFVPKGPINNSPALVQKTRNPCAKPLSKPMMVSLPTHICIIRPQWVKRYMYLHFLSFVNTRMGQAVEILAHWSLYYTTNTMAADVRGTQGARASAVMVLILFTWNIAFSSTEGLTNWGLVMPYGNRNLGQLWLR